MDKSRILSILNINELIFEVKDDAKSKIDVTNLDDRQCTCGKWQHTLLPCTHAIRACNFKGWDIYEYCSIQYNVQTYFKAHGILMERIPNPYELETQSQRQNIVLPPITQRPPGRPRIRR